MNKNPSPCVSIGLDVGGTFTDLTFFDDSTKEVRVLKVPTSKNIESAILEAISASGVDASTVRLISHATTTATNALLTATGLAKTALVTNEGFRDVLEIGRQRRPELYNLYSKRPAPLVQRKFRFTIKGRILHDGSERERLNPMEISHLGKILQKEKFDCVVVGLLNSYANPIHEKKVATLLKRSFKGRIILSSEVNNEYREYERFSTAVVNAALVPLMSKYLKNLEQSLKRQLGFDCPIYLMNSDGDVSTLSHAAQFPISVVESGPAAGVLACLDLAKSLSLDKVATFDMGGTTAKAGMITNFEPDIAYEFEAAGASHSGRSIKGSGYPVRHPFIDLAEVSAGGGTIAWVDEAGALRLGPQSAGANPGPAAYGKGGAEPTITDANIILGRLSPDHFLGGKMKLDPKLSEKAIEDRVAKKMGVHVEEAARNMLRIVNHNMARAISIVSVERGRDPREYSLVAFGGAGPAHACDLAEEMEMREIIVPLHPGLFSAYGLLTVDLARMTSKPVLDTKLSLEAVFEKLRDEASRELEQEGIKSFSLVEYLDVRYKGQSYEITVPRSDLQTIKNTFHRKHEQLYGYCSPGEEIEIVNAKLRAVATIPKAQRAKINKNNLLPSQVESEEKRKAWISGNSESVPIIIREGLEPDQSGAGPSIIEEYDSTTVVNSGWRWRINEFLDIELRKM